MIGFDHNWKEIMIGIERVLLRSPWSLHVSSGGESREKRLLPDQMIIWENSNLVGLILWKWKCIWTVDSSGQI